MEADITDLFIRSARLVVLPVYQAFRQASVQAWGLCTCPFTLKQQCACTVHQGNALLRID